MATVQGLFADSAQAEQAVEQLRGMDISTSEISMLTRSDDEGGVLVIAQVPEGQKMAAQQILNMQGATGGADDTAGYTEDALRGGRVDETGRNTTSDAGDDVRVGERGSVSGMLGGTAASGGLPSAGAAPMIANLTAQDVDEDYTATSGGDHNVADTPGTFMGGGATSPGADLPNGDRSGR